MISSCHYIQERTLRQPLAFLRATGGVPPSCQLSSVKGLSSRRLIYVDLNIVHLHQHCHRGSRVQVPRVQRCMGASENHGLAMSSSLDLYPDAKDLIVEPDQDL